MENNNYQNTRGSAFSRWLLSMSCVALCLFASSANATTLISPTGDGGFETGATFALNNWTVVNAATNTFQVGAAATAFAGARGAYVSNNGGTTYAYTITTSQTSHFYRDIVVPSGEGLINLSFQWKGSGESGFDRLLVYTAPTSVTPVANTPASSSTTLTGATLVFSQPSFAQTTYTTATISLPASLAGTTVRVIFTWQNDASGGVSPAGAVDNISMTSVSCSTNPVTGTKVIGTAGDYTTLTAAMADINARGVSGNVFLELNAAYTASSETFPITLGFSSCMSPSNTVTIRPGTGVTGKSISSTNTTATFDVNGGTYYTIDGRAGGAGVSQLSIGNTGAAAAIRFINDGANNTVKYVSVTSNETSATSGLIFFSTTTGTTGNDNNTIDNCNLNGGGVAYNIIYASGTTTSTATNNSGIVISNCNLYDQFIATTITTGILVSSGNTDWTITGNSFYQTATRIFTTGLTQSAININNTSGNNFIITNNFIGGSAAGATGTPWTIAGSVANRFRGISLSVGTTTASSVQGNTIANFSMTSNSSSTTAGGSWVGIYHTNGNANIGTTTGNTIGSGTGNGSILLSLLTNSGGRAAGIFVDAASSVVSVSNNTVGSVTMNASTISHSFVGIAVTSGTTITVNNNLIGSLSTANSINNNTGATSATGQFVTGILNTSTATIAITNNTIANVLNNYLPAAVYTSQYVLGGIVSTGGVNTITGNTIRNMTTAANATGTSGSASVIGISVGTATVGNWSVGQNSIYSLSNTHASAAALVTGMYYGTLASTGVVARNLIYGLDAGNATATISGIHIGGGTATYQNNMIRLGTAGTVSTVGMNLNGIFEPLGTDNIYHNTVYIGGAPTSGANASYAFNSQQTVNTRDFRDNIFINARSNGAATSKHYAVRVGGTAANPAGLTINYNIYRATGNGAVFGFFNSLDVADITAWRIAVGQDVNSIITDPCLAGPTATTPDLHLTDCATAGSAADGSGVALAAVTDDYDGQTRASFSPVDIGADAGNYGPSGVDVGITASTRPTATSCHSAAENVIVTLSNFSTNPITLSANPITVTVTVTGAVSATLSVTLDGTSGPTSIGAGSSVSVTVGQINTTANGTYNLSSTAVVTGDINNANNTAATSVVINYVSPSVTLTPSASSLCNSGSATLTAVGSNGSVPYTYSLNGGTSQSSGIFSTGTITSTQTYTVVMTDACGTTTSATTTVTVNNPSVTGTTPGTRCGTGTVSLSATGSAGTSLAWYSALSGGAAIGTGSPFVTPSISATTNYYVEAALPISGAILSVGAGGSTSSSYESPFYHLYGGKKSQYMIRASELTAAGISAGNINSVAFDVVTGGTIFNSFNISAKLTAATVMTTTMETGLTSVYSAASVTPTTGINTYPFSSSFNWDGTSNLIIEICWSNNNTGGTSNTVKMDATSFVAHAYYRADATAAATLCAVTTATSTTSLRPKMIFNATGSCASSSRTLVVATVNTPPSVTASASPATICSGTSTTLSVSSSNASYTYSWNNGGGTGASVSVSPASTTTYTVTATDNTAGANAGCITSATTTVTVNPTPSALTITPSAPAICAGGSQTLTASGGTLPGYAVVGTGVVANTASTTTNIPPYGNYYTGNRHQMLILASELSAAGLSANSSISALAFDVVSNTNALGYQNFTIKVGATAATALTTTFETSSTTQVYQAGNFNPVAGLNTHAFSTPYVWNGTSNLLVETYFSNCGITAGSSCSGTTCTGSGSGITYTQNAIVNQTTTGFVSHSYFYSDAASCNIQTAASASATNSTRPNMRLTFAAPSTLSWSPNTASTASVTVSPTSTTTYTVTATSGAGCSTSATAIVTVNPTPVVSGTTTPATCFGTSTGSISASSTGTAPYAYTLNGSNPNNTGSYLGLAAGTYTVASTDNNGCTGTASFTITQPTALSVTASATNTTCAGGSDGSVTFSASGGTTAYAYTVNANSATSPLTGLAAGSYIIVATDANGCTASTTVTITSPAALTVSATNTGPVCQGFSFSLNGTSGFLTYAWSGPLSYSATGQSVTVSSATPAMSGTYSLLATAANGCTATATTTVTVNATPATPTVSVSAASICAPGTITFTSSYSGAGNVWTPGGATTASVTASGAGSYSYSVVYTDGNGCTSAASAAGTGVIYPANSVSVTPATGSFCVSTVLTSSVTGGNVWSTTETTDAITVTSSNTYSVTNTDANGCSAVASAAITVNPAAPVSVTLSVPNTSICSGQSSTFTATATNGGPGATYEFFVGGISQGAATTSNTFTYSPANGDVVSCVVVSNAVCNTGSPATSNSLTMNVIGSVPASVSLSASATNVCAGSSVTLTATPTNGGTPTYEYFLNGTSQGLASASNTFTYTPSANANATVVMTSSLGCATGSPATSNTVAITSVATPATPTVTVSAATTCGSNITFTSSYSTGNVWTPGGATSQTITASTPGAYSYTVVYTDPNGCVSPASAPATATIYPANSVSVTPASATFCGSGVLTSSVSGGNVWSTTETTNAITVTSSGTYTVVNTDGNGCTASASAAIVVNSIPTTPTITASSSTICAPGTITLTSSYSGAGNVWSPGGATTSSITVSTPGTYTYTVTYTSSGCTATSSPVTVTVYPANSVSIAASNSGILCTGGTVTLTATPGTGNVWSTTETTASIVVSAAGTYSVTNTNANGCTATASSTVVSSAPTASIAATCTNLLAGNSTTLTTTATAGTGTITTYQYVLNGVTNVGTNSATFTTSTAGSYTVIVTNSSGCTVTGGPIVISNTAPLSGAYTIGGAAACNNFTSFANAFIGLNNRGVSGPVTIAVASGYTETAPVGGLVLSYCGIAAGIKPNATNTVTFTGGATHPIITAAVGTTTTLDGIIKLVGADYITFDGIDVKEATANTTATTQAEWGYALLKCDGNNGSNYNTIKNCVITLNKTNVATVGIYSGNHIATSTTGLTFGGGTTASLAVVDSSRNGHNTFSGNTISNVYSGLSLNGNSASAGGTPPYSCNDTLMAVLNNTISNFGGSSSVAYGVTETNSRGISVRGNTITSATGTSTTLYGINVGSGSWCDVSKNTITLQGTSTVYHIYSAFNGGDATNPNIVKVDSNTIQNSIYQGTGSMYGIYMSAPGGTNAQISCSYNTVQGYTTTSTGACYGFYCFPSATNGTFNFTFNKVQNNIMSSSNTFYGMYAYCTGGTINWNNCLVNNNNLGTSGTSYLNYLGSTSLVWNYTNNSVTNNFKNPASGAAGTMYCIYNLGTSTNPGTYSNNTVSGNTMTGVSGTGTGTIYGMYNSNSSANATFSTNSISGLSITGTSSGASTIYGMYCSASGGGNTFSSNTISGLSYGAGLTGTSTLIGFYGLSSGNNTYSLNKISGLTTAAAVNANVYGAFLSAAGTSSFERNKIYSLIAGGSASVVRGIYVSGGTQWDVKNNIIGDLNAQFSTSTNGTMGIDISGATTINASFNTIRLTGSAGGGVSGIFYSATPTSVVLRNNLVHNTMTAGGASFSAVIRNATTTVPPTNFNTASNNNLYFASGTGNNVTFYNGTTGYTFAAYKALGGLSPRESSSVTEDVTAGMANVATPANTNYLHWTAGASTLAESGAISISGITNDFDGDVRNLTAPDIGADEFAGTAIRPVIVSISHTPSTTQCVATARAVTAVITGSGLTVNLSYSYNGGTATVIPMTNSGGNNWIATIPAATPVNAVVTYTVTATDGIYSPVAAGTSYSDAPLTGVTATASASPNPICAGSSTTLSASGSVAGLGPIGAGASTSTSYESPFYHLYGGKKSQYLIRAADLTAAGFSAGNLNSLAFEVVSAGTVYNSFSINMKATASTVMTTTLETGLSTVYSAASVTPTVGVNTYPFSSAFNWNGTSNIIVEVCWSNNNTGGTSGTVKMDATAYVSHAYYRADSQTSAVICGTTAATGTQSLRPKMTFSGNRAPSVTFSWYNGATLLGSGSTFAVTPASTTTYTAVATDANGCTLSASTTVNVNPIPTTPTATNSSQCGSAIPTCSVTGSGGTYRWYTLASGGTAIAGETGTQLVSTTVSTTTTFYVAEFDGFCESARVPVTVTVSSPIAISATSSVVSNTCPFTNFTLNATSANDPNYAYTWTAAPVAGSGIPTSVSGASPVIQATTGGTYVYTVSGYDAVSTCGSTATVSVVVTAPPVISAATATPSTVCAGGSVSLLATTTTVSPGTVTLGTGTVVNTTTTYPTPYGQYYGSSHEQYLIKASELTTAGVFAGPITSLAFNLNAAYTFAALQGYQIQIAHTAATALTSSIITTGFTTVYGPSTYTPPAVAGWAPITFATPFSWNGTSNLVIDVWFSNCSVCNGTSSCTTSFTSNGAVQQTTTTFSATSNVHADANCTINSFTPSATSTVYSQRPNMRFGAQTFGTGAGSLVWTWNPGSLSGNAVTVNPTATTTYTVQAYDAVTGCSNFANVPVTVNPLPATPVGTPSAQCGPGVPTCSVSSTGGLIRWYLTPTGGSPLAGESGLTLTAYSISVPTTFYVSEFNGTCESARVSVFEDVVTGGPVSLTASAPVCVGSSVTLTGTDIDPYGYINYTFSASPAVGSGIPSPVTGVLTSPQVLTVSPTIAGTYVYTFSATDGTCTSNGTVTVVVGTPPTISSATAAPNPVCSGSAVTLTGLTTTGGPLSGQLGTATTTSTSQPNPYYTTYWGNKNQYLIKASELTGLGFSAGNISSLGFNLGTVSTTLALTNFTISIGNTALTAMPAVYQTGLTQVYTNASYTLVPSTINTHTFSTPFYWNGTSNIIVETCFNNSAWNGSQTISYSTTSYVSAISYQADVATVCSAPGTPTTSSNRPNMYLNGTNIVSGPGSSTWQWTPGGAPAGNVATVNPTATTTYTVTATQPSSGCTSTATVTVNVNPLPSTPTAIGSTQCGYGIPTATVSGSGGSFRWYLTATGGTALAGEIGAQLTAYNINATTTFYVSEFDGLCESQRVAVTANVTQPDAVSASTSTATGCTNNSVNLIATQTGSTNVYTFTWTATPAAGSGIATSVTGSTATVTPTAVGTYVYNVVASDASTSCNTFATVSFTVSQSPLVTVTPVTSTVCPGTPVQLSAVQSNGAGTAMTLNGVNQYLAIPTSSSLNLSTTAGSSFTLEAWTKASSFIFDGGIISHYQSVGGAGYFLRQGSVSPYSGIGAGGNTEVITTPTTGVVTASTWAHVAAVFSYNSATTNDSVKIYVNGVLKGSGVTTVAVGTDSVRIGSDYSSRYFSGQIDEVRIWNAALNGTTIANWMGKSITASHPQFSNLVAYYNFDASATSTVSDLSGNSNTAYIRNSAGQAASSAPITNSTYSWSPSTDLTNASIANPIASPSTSTVYTVTVTTPNGCTATGTSTLTVVPTSPAPTATNSTQCGNGVPLASVSGSGGTFRWYLTPTGGTALAGETGTSLSAYSIAATTTFYVSEFDGLCEGPRAAVTATVTYPDAVTASSDLSSVCGNAPITLTATNTGTTNTYSYSWTASPLTGSGISTPVAGSPATVTPTAGGTFSYIVTATDASVGCVTTASVSVTVTAPPSILSATASPTSICLGSSVTLTGLTGSFGPGSGNIGGAGTTSIGGSDGNPYRSGNGVGNQIRIQLLVTASELASAGFVQGNLTSLAFTTQSASTGTISNFTISLGATSATALTSTFETTPMTQVYTIASFTPASAGINTHVFTTPFYWNGTSNIVINTCQTNNISGTATVTCSTPAFIGTISKATTTTSCTALTGTTVTARPIMQFGGVVGVINSGSYNWVWNPGALAGNVVTTIPASAGTQTYTVTATDPASGCSSTASVNVNVISSPATPIITVAPTAICGSGTVTLTVTNATAGAAYQWLTSTTGAPGSFTQVAGANTTTFTTSTLTASAYFSAFVTCGGTNDTSTATLVTVNSPAFASGSATPRCGPGTVTFTATGTGTFDWYSGSSGGTALALNTSTYTANVTGNTTLWVIAHIGTCMDPSGRNPVTVTVSPAPAITLTSGPASPVCSGTTINLSVTSPNDPNYSYAWNNGAGTGASVSVIASSTTTYTVVATDNSTGCQNSASAAYVVNSTPATPIINPSSASVCNSGDCVTLNVTNAASAAAGFATVGAGAVQNTTTSTTEMPPYGNWYTGNRHQILVRAAELTAQGIVAGPINSLAFDVVSDDATLAYNGFNIKIGATAATVLSSTFETSSTTNVYSAATYIPVTGWNTHAFSTPFVWNGTSNILIETYFSNCTSCSGVTCSTTGSGVSYDANAVINNTTTSYISHSFYYSDGSGCSPETQLTATATTTTRPNIKFNANVSSAITYTWSPSATTGTSYIACPTATTTYTVTASTAAGCSSSASATITYSPLTPPTIVASANTVCSGSAASLDAGAGYGSYSWSNGTSVVGTSQVLNVNPTANTTYTVTVTNGACTATASKLISVYTVSIASVTSSAILPLCSPATTTLSVSPTGFTSYAWSTAETTSSIVASTSGTYSVLVTDANGCTQTPSIVVGVNPSPTTATVTATGSPNLCWDGITPASVTLTADTTGAGAGAYIQWNNYDGSGTDVITIDNNDLSFQAFTNPYAFNFTVFNSYGCPAISNSITVTSDLAPSISALSTTSACNGSPVTISGANFTGVSAVSFNGTAATFTVVNDGSITTTVPAGATTGTITVTSGLGVCTATSGVFTVQCGSPMVINLTAFLQGYYVGASTMTPALLYQNVVGATGAEVDTIQVEIYDQTTFALAGSAKAVLMTNGTASATIYGSNNSYYVAIRHRNSVLTWTSVPVAFSSVTPASYNFSSSLAQTFAGWMADDYNEGIYSIFSGDINQDEYVDANDYPTFDIDNSLGLCCDYYVTDLNGDGFVDASDYPFFDGNNAIGVFSIHP